MNRHVMLQSCRAVILAGAILAPAAAFAACSRVINVPVSATGRSVVINGDSITGVYPDVLRAVGPKEGCSFAFSVVPRARLAAMFEVGDADLLIPAARTPHRDEQGVFVPLIFSRAMLISIGADRPAIRNAQQLLDQRELRVAFVRGYDYGSGYQSLLKELSKQRRVFMEVDAAAIVRLMEAGVVDATIMAPSILAGAMLGGSRALLSKLRYEAMSELPWGDSGAYISKRSVSPADTIALQELLERAAKSGAVWNAFQRYYPPEVLSGSIRPR
jgi:polar amino acid transport system substrate-binding protein